MTACSRNLQRAGQHCRTGDPRAECRGERCGLFSHCAPATTNLDAYEAYLLGMYQDSATDRITAPVNARVIETFEPAVALDPGFALAHARLSIGTPSDTCSATTVPSPGFDRPALCRDGARSAAGSRDWSYGAGQLSLCSHRVRGCTERVRFGTTRWSRRQRFARQDRRAQRWQGQWDRAIESFTRALGLDSLSPELERDLAATLFHNRHYDHAILHFDLSIAGAPGQLVPTGRRHGRRLSGAGRCQPRA